MLPSGQQQVLVEFLGRGATCLSAISGAAPAQLPGPTHIVATTTPISGRYDSGKSLCQNLSLTPCLVERFDMVILVQDRAEDPATRAIRAPRFAEPDEGLRVLATVFMQLREEKAADLLFACLCSRTVRGALGAMDGPQGPAHGKAKRGNGYQARRQRFMSALHRKCLVEGSLTQTVDGMKELAKASHTFQPDFDGFLERLNEHGDVLKKGAGLYAYNGPV
ncbi:hypothetical protein QBZ16_003325 [Prototheca wickerhamii]|uniref:MCM C-terminal AAA(+) ATPase domain-containing protein n=1 Tax=Prototheca wickerhamii TaxID=3111 RepID=A0AAD9IKT2_PROWI|nr:hypothetical protein QBZ16_003325 [Prototheca wickerhamii]